MHYPATFLPVLVDSIFCGNLSPLHPKLKKYWLKCYCFVIESCKCTRPEFLKRKAIFSVLVLSEINFELNEGVKETPSLSHDHVKPVSTTMVNRNIFLIKSSCRFLEISIVCLGCTHEIRHASDADACAHVWMTEFRGHILSKVYKFTALTLSLAFAAEISVSLRLLLWLESSSFTLAMEEPSKTPVTHLPCS